MSGAEPSEALDLLRAEIADRAGGLRGEALFLALRPMLEDHDIVRRLVAAALAAMRREPDRPLRLSSHASANLEALTLFAGGDVHLSLLLIPAPRNAPGERPPGVPGILRFADGWTRLSVLAGGPARAVRFERDAEAGAVRPQRQPVDIGDGEWIDLANAGQALHFLDPVRDLAVLRLIVRDPACEQAVDIDAVSGAVVQRRQTRPADSRLQLCMALLRSLGRADAIPEIRRMLPDLPPYLRWQAARECLMLDAEAGLALLADLQSSDPDARLRAQAGATRQSLLARRSGIADAA